MPQKVSTPHKVTAYVFMMFRRIALLVIFVIVEIGKLVIDGLAVWEITKSRSKAYDKRSLNFATRQSTSSTQDHSNSNTDCMRDRRETIIDEVFRVNEYPTRKTLPQQPIKHVKFEKKSVSL